jgi:peptidoglycan/xylan/chitin deacetylase (PgdA/CDA1 family)
MSRAQAVEDVRQSVAAISRVRDGRPPTSFRAPNLDFPSAFVPILTQAGFTVDASEARYKPPYARARRDAGILRLPASVTSSALRLPALIRNAMMRGLADPIVLFVHPWEFVDLRNAAIRWDCRLRTGEHARRALSDAIGILAGRLDRFQLVRDFEIQP